MNAIVIYKSSTGFTKKYAGWIAEALACEAVAAEQAKSVDFGRYDAVVFGGWAFAGSIHGLKEYKEKLLACKGKKAVFLVGAMPADAPEATAAFRSAFTEEERAAMGTFYLQGGLDYAHMGLAHKAMMKMMCAVMKKQKGVDSPEYQGISRSFDATDKAAVAPLVHYLTL